MIPYVNDMGGLCFFFSFFCPVCLAFSRFALSLTLSLFLLAVGWLGFKVFWWWC